MDTHALCALCLSTSEVHWAACCGQFACSACVRDDVCTACYRRKKAAQEMYLKTVLDEHLSSPKVGDDDGGQLSVGVADGEAEDDYDATAACWKRVVMPDGSVKVVHFVSELDTLPGIALRYGVSVHDIMRENRLTSEFVFDRTELAIPEPERMPRFCRGPSKEEQAVIELNRLVRAFRVQTRASHVEAQYYIDTNRGSVEHAVAAYKADLEWEAKHPISELRRRQVQARPCKHAEPKKKRFDLGRAKKVASCFVEAVSRRAQRRKAGPTELANLVD